MIYSRFRPERGGYDYFESAERYGLGDDLPSPRLPYSSDIGLSSIDAGRTTTAALRPVGAGPRARGMVMPTSRAGLSGGGVGERVPLWLVALGSGACGWVLARIWKRAAS